MSYLPNHAVLFEPIDRWPGAETFERSYSPFRKGWSRVLRELDLELSKLDASRVVFRVDLPRTKIRQDGAPRADARMGSPRVIVSFDSRHGPLAYPCDTFCDWKDNVYAIARALNALRMVDRYGVTARGEQYRGFTPLPAPDKLPFNTADEAMAWLVGVARVEAGTHDLEVVYRKAQANTHPDRRGGSATDFKRVTAAGELLGVA